jgi:hypothetical protein
VYHTNPKRQTPEQRAEERRRYPHGVPDEGPEGPLLRINKLGPEGNVLSTSVTGNHKLRVTPGRYGVAVIERPPGPYKKTIINGPAHEVVEEEAFGTHVYVSKKVAVRAGQTLEVMLTVIDK